MEKKLIYVIIAVIVIVLIGVGVFVYASKDKSEKVSDNVGEQKQEAFVLKSGDKEIVLGEEFSTEKCGKEKEYSEIPSCAFNGIDKTYKYDNYEITTYPDGAKDRILSIYFLDSGVSTTEGVKIADSYDDMVQAYGNEYENEGNKYSYKKGKTRIEFLVENKVITSIEYRYDV